jgi:ABC-type transport system involved in multi-copper enzyme maturation permease subunit
MMAEMRMLLWKDIRLSRICLFGGIGLTVFPYLFLLGLRPHGYEFKDAWAFSTMLSQLAIALLAGNIVVCERADRSATFLAFQGVTRRKVIASKLIICIIVFILICAISMLLSNWLNPRWSDKIDDPIDVQYYAYAVGFCFFGSCWLLSSLLPSAISAIVFGWLSPFFLLCILSICAYYFNWPSRLEFGYWFIGLSVSLGFISLVAGTWYFLRSKEA